MPEVQAEELGKEGKHQILSDKGLEKKKGTEKMKKQKEMAPEGAMT
jgi:hypothetical protein